MDICYCRSFVVEQLIIEAKKQGKNIRVIIVDSRPLYEGIYEMILLKYFIYFSIYINIFTILL